MSSRDKIIATVKQNEPPNSDLPLLINYDQHYANVQQKFIDVLSSIGGTAILVKDYNEVASIIAQNFSDAKRIVFTGDGLASVAETGLSISTPHELADADLFITVSNLAVAENGAIWLKDDQLQERVLPFIAQQIAVIIHKENIVATMHDAYEIIGTLDYGYAAFIAGPSKTADIAQSLVLGAHGPKTMTIFILS